MLSRCLVLILAMMGVAAPAGAQAPGMSWPDGARAAIVLTYDDALLSQLDIAIPQLDAAGLRGTFFLKGTLAPASLPRWRAAAAAGHELGNHSIYHPCPAASYPAEPQYHAENYSVATMVREIGVMNTMLLAIDGRTERNYSVPCSQTLVGGEDYVEALRGSGLIRFVRTGGTGDGVIADPAALDPMRVPSRSFIEINDSEDLIGFVEAVRRAGGLGIFMFHGVGGDYLNVSAEAHQALVRYLAEHRQEIWVAPFGEVMAHVTAQGSHGRAE